MKHIFEHTGTIRYIIRGNETLQWREDLGIGHFPESTEIQYDADYWAKYQGYADSQIGKDLLTARTKLVARYMRPDAKVCDVGIGNGSFVLGYPSYGYDVNPVAVEWLKEQKRFADPYVEEFDALCFWDVLEHIEDPLELLTTQMVFISVPIHQTLDGLLQSKHFRPGEHIWHFTLEGMINYMDFYGYRVLEVNTDEIKAGREAILSFAFQKVNK